MSNSEKSKFVVYSLTKAMENRVNEFKESKVIEIKSMEDSLDFEDLSNFMKEMVEESVKAVEDWEKDSLQELDGMTPPEYFYSLNDINDIIELVSLFEKNGGVHSIALIGRIKDLDEAFGDGLKKELDSLELGEDACFTFSQRAMVRIAELIGSPKFIEALANIISDLDDDMTNDETIDVLMDAMKGIGQPVLETLMNLVENSNKESRLYGCLLNVIGKIASKNKSEQIYNYLRDCFRKSETKFTEANAFASYGDGRAVAAIRGYVDRNKDKISNQKYTIFKNSIILLGGSTDDFDRFFKEDEV